MPMKWMAAGINLNTHELMYLGHYVAHTMVAQITGTAFGNGQIEKLKGQQHQENSRK